MGWSETQRVQRRGDCTFDKLDLPLDQSSLRTMFGVLRTEIFHRNLDELSSLLGQYVSFSRGAQSYFTSLHIEDGRAGDIPASHVPYIATDGNYARGL